MLAVLLLALTLPAAAAGGVDVHFFWRNGCPHCEREMAFLDRVAAANPAVRLHKRELGLLAGMKDRVRMWTLGIAFVAASALVYLLILGAWLNVLLLAGAVAFVRVAVGIVALAAGGFYLKEFATDADMKCEVTAPRRHRRVLERLRGLAQRPGLAAALGGIVLLAFAVNVVEFLCSAGIPAVFAQVLALSPLAPWQYAAFLVLYVAVFMLDDLVVLVVALKTLEVAGLTTRYARWSNAVGGVALLAVGALLVFRPDWLAFS